jgi:hypothetical protein
MSPSKPPQPRSGLAVIRILLGLAAAGTSLHWTIDRIKLGTSDGTMTYLVGMIGFAIGLLIAHRALLELSRDAVAEARPRPPKSEDDHDQA